MPKCPSPTLLFPTSFHLQLHKVPLETNKATFLLFIELLTLTMSKTTSVANTRTQVWRSRLGSALRTTLACIIVGCTTLYGPKPVRRQLEFPAFSYVTTILIVSDATLGDTLRGLWHASCATLQVMILSFLSLWVIGPAHFAGRMVAALTVAADAFVVALPESTNLLTKRIAFGQLVIVYVNKAIHGAEARVLMHKIIQVACSTALGAVASVLAMLLPYPRLAYFEVRKESRLYAENISERFNHFLEAICALEKSTADDHITKAKLIFAAGAKHLQNIRRIQDSMYWERFQLRISNLKIADPEEKLQSWETPIRGMEIALSSCPSFQASVMNEELRDVLLECRRQFSLKLEQAKCFAPFNTMTAPEAKQEFYNNFSGCFKSCSIASKDLPTSFFLYCVRLLIEGSPIANNTKHTVEKTQNTDAEQRREKRILQAFMNILPSGKNLAFAFKCSASLGLALLFGLMYDTEEGYWSGLTISITLATGQQATFSVANARGQGTAMGSVYGILCCFIFQRFVNLRLLPLLPWVIFSSILMHSRIYGQAGGISAAIGALLILGRKHYGSPTQFAITRITEATIGLLCCIIIEILLWPSRAATLAKSEFSQSLKALQDCIVAIEITPRENHMPSPHSQALRERQKKLKSRVNQLEEFVAQAELEPNFWFLPFPSACYSKILESLSRMITLLHFMAYSTEKFSILSQKDTVIWRELQGGMKEHIEFFKTKVSSTLKCLEEITRIKSVTKLEKDLRNRSLPREVETGKYPNADAFRILSENEEVDGITGSCLQYLEEMADKIHTDKDEILKCQQIFHYSCLGFCISSLMRETMNVQKNVNDLLIWENPTCHASLYEIYCKINALRSQ